MKSEFSPLPPTPIALLQSLDQHSEGACCIPGSYGCWDTMVTEQTGCYSQQTNQKVWDTAPDGAVEESSGGGVASFSEREGVAAI